jgi:hypothetical protein
MILKSGFFLIELMVAITLFIFFLSAICSLQVISIKNRDFATKRMMALNDLITEIEGFKQRDFIENQKVIIENLPEIKVADKSENSFGNKRKNQIVQLKKYSMQKEILGKKICTVSLTHK